MRSLKMRDRAFAALLFVLAACLTLATLVPVYAAGARAERPSVVAASGAQEASSIPPENASEVSRQSVHGIPWVDTIARLVNFAILAGVLVYFLRAPIASYLARRSSEIRADLVKAAQTRETASAELAAIEQRMKELPGELDALKERGAAEIAAEEARIRAASEAERTRLLEQARREIEMRLRTAERDLIKRAAELTVALASDRVRRTITDEDQKRLVNRYLGEIQR